MRILVTGASGLLGLNAALQLKDRHQVSGVYCSHPVRIEGVETFFLDLRAATAVRDLVLELRPQAILHTAGLTNVDACEVNPREAEELHVQVSEHVAHAAGSVGAMLVHISTDHLFDGQKALVEENESPAPLNQYARTKFAAEQRVRRISPGALIVRTNFYGWGTALRASFSDWILAGLEQRKILNMFTDVFFTPILANDLIERILDLVKAGANGIYHVAGGERISKYDFAIELASIFNYPTDRIHGVSIQEISLRARRPYDMSLKTDKAARLLGRPMPLVSEGLVRLKELELQGWRQLMYKSILTDNRIE